MEKRPTPSRKARGFTLIELLVTMSVLAILAAVGIPGFQTLIQRNAMRELQADFSSSMQRARLDAISRNTCVSVCPMAANGAQVCEQTAANLGNWHQGWILFVNPACTAPPPGGPAASDIIQVRQPGRPRFTLTDQGGNLPSVHTFNARGLLRSTARTFVLSDADDEQAPYKRCLAMNLQGRLLVRMPNADGGC